MPVQPQTFDQLPWVAGIDSLDLPNWMAANPDGRDFIFVVRDLDKITRDSVILHYGTLLRSTVKLMLQGEGEGRDSFASSMLGIIGILDDAPVWQAEGKSYQSVLKEDLGRLVQLFPGCSSTFAVFVQHLKADAEYYLEQARSQPSV